MHYIECPVLVQKEHNANEAESMIVSIPEENITSNNKIEIQCRIANCAVQAVLANRSKQTSEMTTFGLANSELCTNDESSIEPDIKVYFHSTHSE
jgi:hypothetical protein